MKKTLSHRRKKDQIAEMLAEYSEDDLLAKLEGEAPPPNSLHHRLAGLIPVSIQVNFWHSWYSATCSAKSAILPPKLALTL